MKTSIGGGDLGMTSLLSGERVSKSHERIEACGELDELSSVLGSFAAALNEGETVLIAEIHEIQGELLRIGAWLATSPGSSIRGALPPFEPGPLHRLERSVERMEASLPPLAGFILPGGHPSSAWAHLARTVCRRAERRAAALAVDQVPAQVLPYLNRLSTYLFVTARYCNNAHGVAELSWKG